MVLKRHKDLFQTCLWRQNQVFSNQNQVLCVPEPDQNTTETNISLTVVGGVLFGSDGPRHHPLLSG